MNSALAEWAQTIAILFLSISVIGIQIQLIGLRIVIRKHKLLMDALRSMTSDRGQRSQDGRERSKTGDGKGSC